MTASKFQTIFDARKDGQAKALEETTASAATTAQTDAKPLGRPRNGKRSSADFTQITAYIRRDTHKAVKIALLQEGEDRELSELVESLLAEWLKARR